MAHRVVGQFVANDESEFIVALDEFQHARGEGDVTPIRQRVDPRTGPKPKP
jgi:hypothetical protein